MRVHIEAVAFLAAASLLIGTVAWGAPMNWEGTAWVELYESDNKTINFTGGGVATVNGTSGVIGGHMDTIRLAKDRGLIEGSHFEFITDPEVAGIGIAAFDFVQVQGLSGTGFGSFPALTLPGAVPVGGYVKVCLLSPACTTYLPIALTQPTTVNGVPGGAIEGMGVGGLITAGGYGGIRLSIQHGPWTIKTVSAVNLLTNGPSTFYRTGFAHGPASDTSSTAQPGGAVQFVAPTVVVSNLPRIPVSWNNGVGDPSGQLTAVNFMRIRFIPEPGRFLLLGAGVVGLLTLRRLRA